jgi:hypothetical protein
VEQTQKHNNSANAEQNKKPTAEQTTNEQTNAPRSTIVKNGMREQPPANRAEHSRSDQKHKSCGIAPRTHFVKEYS